MMMPRNNFTPRISIITGVVHRGDAMSETVACDLDALDMLSVRERRNLDVQIYCMSSDLMDTRVRVVNDWRQILKEEHFATSDLYYFHFGVYNDVHNCMNHTRRDARLAIFFQGITPPQYCPPQAEDLIYRSFQQIENFHVADAVFAASEYSANQLRAYGLARPATVVPLFGPNAGAMGEAGEISFEDAGRPLHLLYCGRFARSKGVTTLLEALALAEPALARPVTVTLAGITEFSDQAYIREVDDLAQTLPERVALRFKLNSSSAEIRRLFAEADVFVLPSFHEGFGMPVAEAFLAGTPVICTTAGALPELTGHLASTFTAGKVEELATCLSGFCAAFEAGEVACDRGRMPREEWRSAVKQHAARFTRDAYIERITARLSPLLVPTPSWAETRRRALRPAALPTKGDVAADPIGPAIVGALTAARALRLETEIEENLRHLLRWAFPVEQSASDVEYWVGVYRELGRDGLISRLASAAEVRSSAAARQAGIFVRGWVTARAAVLDEPPEPPAERNLNRELEIALLADDVNQSPYPFLLQCYRLVLGREPDEVGLAHHLELLRGNRLTRRDIVDALKNSAEALAQARATAGGSAALPRS